MIYRNCLDELSGNPFEIEDLVIFPSARGAAVDAVKSCRYSWELAHGSRGIYVVEAFWSAVSADFARPSPDRICSRFPALQYSITFATIYLSLSLVGFARPIYVFCYHVNASLLLWTPIGPFVAMSLPSLLVIILRNSEYWSNILKTIFFFKFGYIFCFINN